MTPPLIILQNVSVALGGHPVLRDLTWDLLPGQSWAVLGGNGAGKSTFLRLVRGELWPAPGRGRRVYALDGSPQSTAIGVTQAMPLVSPETQARCLQMEWTRSVQELVESGVGGGDYNCVRLTTAQRREAWRAAQRTGVDGLWRRNIQQLSTGELRRALIARALAGRPRVLVCDEVCDGLDPAGRRDLLRLLDSLVRQGTQLLLTTHREEELIPALTHCLKLAEGRIERIEALPPRPSRPGPRRKGRLESPAPTLRPASSRPTRSGRAPVLIRMRGASVFLEGRRVLQDLDWEWRQGDHWAVLGPNGSGKSTFLKLVAGDLHPALGGSIRRFEFTARNTLWELRRRIGVVSPELQATYRERLTGAEVIASGFFSSIGLMERPSPQQLRQAAALASRLGFGDLARRPSLALSYGEFRKLLLARALVHRPAVLLLDEPFDGLDAASRRDLARTLERLAGDTSLLLVTHHAADLPRCLTHVLRLQKGRIRDQGAVAGAAMRFPAP